MSSVELPTPLSFDAFVRKSPRKCLAIMRNSKKDIAKNKELLSTSLRGGKTVLCPDISLQEGEEV